MGRRSSKKKKKSSPKRPLTPEEKRICSRFIHVVGTASYAGVARDLEIDASTVSRIMNYVRPPSIATLVKFCRWGEVSADYMLGLTENPEVSDFKASGVDSIRVAVLDSLESVAETDPRKCIVGWLPFSAKEIGRYLGYRLEHPGQLAIVPNGTDDGYVMVDRWFRKDQVQSLESFVVKYEGKLSICKLRFEKRGWEVVMICKEKDCHPFTIHFRRQASKSDVLLARVIRVFSSPDRSNSWE